VRAWNTDVAHHRRPVNDGLRKTRGLRVGPACFQSSATSRPKCQTDEDGGYCLQATWAPRQGCRALRDILKLTMVRGCMALVMEDLPHFIESFVVNFPGTCHVRSGDFERLVAGPGQGRCQASTRSALKGQCLQGKGPRLTRSSDPRGEARLLGGRRRPTLECFPGLRAAGGPGSTHEAARASDRARQLLRNMASEEPRRRACATAPLREAIRICAMAGCHPEPR
jgi:hypothetical protein